MSDIALKVEGLWKQYRLGLVGSQTLKDDLQRIYANLFGKENPLEKIGSNSHLNQLSEKYVWALQDINFEIKKGEVLGIIGKNGAGKSTLLKILSKVTGPSKGKIYVDGRIASLLEVGTGFHPELTGKENIFLNGAILGMKKWEIKAKLEEIVDFAGVEKYLNTPVKRYSSGMHVRLAFAVAAHLEPEILIVDEVLAVGDIEFQKKAIGKMQDVSAGEGRTVLFVSHNMGAVRNLCGSGLLLENGFLSYSGTSDQVVDKYLNSNFNLTSIKLDERKDRKGTGRVIFNEIIYLINNNQVDVAITGKNLTIRLQFLLIQNGKYKNCRIGIAISSNDVSLLLLSTELSSKERIDIDSSGFIDFDIDSLPLTVGYYSMTLFFESNGTIEDWIQDAGKLVVQDGKFDGLNKNYPIGWSSKTVLVKHSFKLHGKN